MFSEFVASACLAWYFFIVGVCTIGCIQLFRYYSKVPERSAVLAKPASSIPHVTIIRPCKGIEPYLYECLSSTLNQDYPREKLTVYYCVGSRNDPAFSTIQRVVRDHPNQDARVFLEDEDPKLIEEQHGTPIMGPNPKIRNMSRAYREAKGDIVWIVDCNVWLDRGTCGRMVDKLCGYSKTGSNRPYKFVHHLPVSIDVEVPPSLWKDGTSQVTYDDASTTPVPTSNSLSDTFRSLNKHGGRLEELFLSSSHAKMYVAINTVAIAPCIVGKSNMFRRSHLDYLTSKLAAKTASSDNNTLLSSAFGIDYFSHNICEDHLIGDLLWRSNISAEPKISNHGLVFGDLAFQPIAGMTVTNYIARRIRWLRVRKFTVPVATLVEPGTESFLCSAYGAFGLTTSERTRTTFGSSWSAFLGYWLLSISIWALVDWTVYILLHSGRTVDIQDHKTASTTAVKGIPAFLQPSPSVSSNITRRSFRNWLFAWLGRESLALPIWTWAIWGGTTVTWRERKFWVGMDMQVHEIRDQKKKYTTSYENGHLALQNGDKKRID